MTGWHSHLGLLLCTALLREAAALSSNQTLGSRSAMQARGGGYTENSLCRQNNCVNPIFPGLNDLPRLEALTWQCATQDLVSPYMDFCKDAVLYEPALPSPEKAGKSVSELVKAQDDAAMTMFFYHLSGLGYDAWDYRQPSQADSECVKAVWKMTCFTYFPRANAGCKETEPSTYQRPCHSCCKNYLKQCGVECCDESVQCSFTHTKSGDDGKTQILQTGYVAVDGPSATCTGGTRRSVPVPILLLLAILGFHSASGASDASGHTPPAAAVGRRLTMWRRLPLVVLLAACALFLQGCTGGIDRHKVGNWRLRPSYLSEFQYIPPGKNVHDAILNSCSVPGISATLQCSGHGYCKGFTSNSEAIQQHEGPTGRPLAFCSCDPDRADPECSTQRKSQMTAWFYSVFLGMFGADYFYLGYPLWGMGKLCTFGGLGCWWLIDIVRIAAGPVYAHNYRTANDLPHWAAMLAMFFVCLMLGFLAAIESYLSYRKQRRADVAKLQNCEEDRHYHNTKAALMPAYGATWPETSCAPRPAGPQSPMMPVTQFGR